MRVVYSADLHTIFGLKADIVGQVLGPRLCVCVHRCLHSCVRVVYRADLYTIFGPKADIVGQVLSPSVCACMSVCDQLSVQVVFMNLSENLFFKVVLDFDLLPHPQDMDPGDRCCKVLLYTFGPSIIAV